ncbi:unnamed protein product [Cyprideis torosa]|uniref:Vacuolar protein sorting-associated protein 16 homolog n=1 Tax=Cyprideis torosa TaxID=163714 RepID=A0A7R8WLG3_9CRUS|nr:unnamed protein product [Cyprideis torosa]CAG0897226.1 unnamed protein product [Cyprideis torosa]
MAASLDGQNLALLSNGILWIGTSDFRRKEAEFDSRGTARAKQLVWCGSDALVALFEEALLVIAKNGQNWFSYTMDPQLVLLPEIDGVTLISSDSREFLEKVHSSCVEIFRIGSMAPGAMLMEAGKEFMNRSHRADDYLREIRSRLKEAVTQCIKAAGFEPEVELQKSLLRAAKLGKGFIPGYDPAPFVDITRSLRAIHSLKTDAGMPLTHAQYKALGERTVLDRLVARKMYLLALKMAEFLRMPEKDGAHRVLVHWACAKVKETKSGDTETVANAIAEKLGYSAGGISFAEIAGKANELGKKQLAAKLLRFESVSSKQVPLLLKLGEDEEALRQAVASGDSDQVFFVLLHLRDKKNLGEFQMSIRGFPVAQSLYIQLCRLQSRDALRDVYQQEDDFLGQATIRLQEAYAAKTTDGELAMLVGAQDCFKKAKTDAAKLWANLTEEESRLLKYQLMESNGWALGVGTHGGSRLRPLAGWIYTAIVRPMLTYASVVWVPAILRQGRVRELEKVQRLGLRLITAAFHTTPTMAMEMALGFEAVDIRVAMEAVWAAVQLKKEDEEEKNRRTEFVSIDQQVSLEQKFRERIFLRRSLIDTVKELLLMREETLADKLRGEFRVNDERFFRLRLQTAAELRDWAYIEKMANLKKVLVGFEVFVSVCLERNQISEAKKYLPRVKDSLKVKYYVQAKLLGEAARIAFERKSLEDMNLVQSRCKPTDREVLALIAKYTQQLASSNPAATAKS